MLRRTRSRKLAIWSALPPYLGGKRRLCPLIFREVDRILPRRLWSALTFLDGFLGGGSVSLYAKAQGFRVVGCDIAERSFVVGQALIANNRVKLTREDILRIAAPSDGPPGPIEQNYAPKTFTGGQARLLDRALALASETPDPAKAALLRLMAIRVALLAHPMSQVRAGTIGRLSTGEYESITESCLYHYVDGLRLTRPGKLWDLARLINAGVFEGEATIHRADLMEKLPEIQADVAYFDPPYPGVMSYEKEYRVIDEILEGSSKPTSPFTARDGASMLDALFERAMHIPVWILSLGNAVVGIEELEAKMTRLGRSTRSIAIKYAHLPAVATAEKREANREFLVIGWDPESPLLQRSSVRGEEVGHAVSERELTDGVSRVETDAAGISTERTASQAGLGNLCDQHESGLSEEPTAIGGDAIPVPQGSEDRPDAVLTEARLDGGGEGRIG